MSYGDNWTTSLDDLIAELPRFNSQGYPIRRKPFGERLMRLLDTSGGPDECWLYRGRTTREGYGKFKVGQRLVGAHRVAYIVWRGPIPAAHQIDHLCRRPGCCNPKHLEAVTPAVNQYRSFGVAGVNARKSKCHRGHVFDAANTYLDRKGGRHCRACGRERQSEYLARRRAGRAAS